MLDNEEEIKNKLLMPYLANLGLDSPEITLERTFKIRLGTNLHDVNGSAGGRLDIACHKNHKVSIQYLFVLELKRNQLALTDDDRDQGISYARVLENIAPFVILSNGSDTAIYDTITRQKIDGERLPASYRGGMGVCGARRPERALRVPPVRGIGQR